METLSAFARKSVSYDDANTSCMEARLSFLSEFFQHPFLSVISKNARL